MQSSVALHKRQTVSGQQCSRMGVKGDSNSSEQIGQEPRFARCAQCQLAGRWIAPATALGSKQHLCEHVTEMSVCYKC